MGEDSQKIAAEAYEYENDPKWRDYWSNILIPPQMASRSHVITHYKRKFYQRYIDPDFVLQPMTSQSTTQSARSSTPPPSTNSGSTTRTTTTSNQVQLLYVEIDKQCSFR